MQPGLVLVTGANGAGKTNLLEAVHVGTQGFSPRTRTEAQVVRFGEEAGRIALAGARGAARVELEVTLRAGEGKRAKLNGAVLSAAEQLRTELAVLVFTPDVELMPAGSLPRTEKKARRLVRLYQGERP